MFASCKFALCMTTFARQRIEKIIIMMKSLFPKNEPVTNSAMMLIHVDNWSKDEHTPNTIGKLFPSPRVFEAYLQKTFSPLIFVISSDHKIGVSESRNKLVQTLSNYPFVSYVKLSDDDDEGVNMNKYVEILKRVNPRTPSVIEGVSTLRRFNVNHDSESIIQTCIKNDYLLTKDHKVLDSIGKFSKGVIWTLIIHKSILSAIPFLTLTSFEDSFFRYMLYEYCRIKGIHYVNVPDVVYVYHGASGNANNYGKKITASDLKPYDDLYSSWTDGDDRINYAQMLKFVFPFIYVVPYFNQATKTVDRCSTLKDLENSIVDFKSFRSKFVPNPSDILFNKKLAYVLRDPPVITDADIYYSVITQYNVLNKELRYINTNPRADDFEPETLENIMKKYPPENNGVVINCYNMFNGLTGSVVDKSIFGNSYISDDYDFYVKYSVRGTESETVMSNFILFSLLKKPVNNHVFVKKMMMDTHI